MDSTAALRVAIAVRDEELMRQFREQAHETQSELQHLRAQVQNTQAEMQQMRAQLERVNQVHMMLQRAVIQYRRDVQPGASTAYGDALHNNVVEIQRVLEGEEVSDADDE